MPYAISAVGSLVENTGTGLTTLAVTPANVGGILVLNTAIVNNTITVTGVSGGGVATWSRIIGPYSAGWMNRNLDFWFGRITSAGAATITITPSASVAAVRVDLGVREYNSAGGASALWAADGSGGTNSGTGTSVVFPTLTPSGPDRLYVGYGPINVSPAGSTPSSGVTAAYDSNGNPIIYNLDVDAAASPTITMTAGDDYFNVAALLVAEQMPVDPLRIPVQIIQVP